MFDTLINAIDVDAAFVLTVVLLTVAVFITGIAGHKRQTSNRPTFASHNSSDVQALLSLGEYITLVAMVPATVYIVTRAFPGFYQQLVVGFIVIALFAGVEHTRITVQIGLTVAIVLALSTVTLPFRIISKILLYVYRRVRGDSPSDDTATIG